MRRSRCNRPMPLACLRLCLGTVLALSGWAAALAPGEAAAQAWPRQTIKMIVPYPAGGATDAVARLFVARFQDQLASAVVVENRAGAGGNIGADAAAKSAPDGYTVLFNINGMAIAPAIYKKLAYDADNDFVRVTQLVSTSTVLVVNNDVPAKSFQELVALAKAKPGVLNYGSTGVGNALHLTVELIKRMVGIEIQMVPFTGDAPLFHALFRGDIQMALLPTSITKEHIVAGAVRAVGISTARRSPVLPTVVPLAEQGLPGFDVRGWMGLFAPKGTPAEIVERYWQETRRALAMPDFTARLATFELEPVGSSPAEFEAVYRADRQRFATVIKEAGIPLQ